MTYRQLIEGAKIFAKYLPEGLDAEIGGATHDKIFFADADLDISYEDREELSRLRFAVDEDVDCWRHFA